MTAPLDFLFPTPSSPPSKLTPRYSPGVSPESTETLKSALKDNHTKWHIFFHDQRFHNHAAHRVLAAWALGADADTIRKGYEKDCGYEKKAFDSPENIDSNNFNDHLGDEKFYSAYKHFFTDYVQSKGISNTLEEFIFSRKANIGASSIPAEKQPQMLIRFLAGVLHPIIHIGYGAEFGLPGMLVEGLAETAVHESTPGLLESLALFDEASITEQLSNVSIVNNASQTFSQAASVVGSAVNAVITHPVVGANSLDLNQPKSKPGAKPPTSSNKEDADPHALTILARILRDPRFSPSPESRKEAIGYEQVAKTYGKDIVAIVKKWDVDPARLNEEKNPGGWEEKVEEIIWSVVVLYGVGGWTDAKAKDDAVFNADFYFMHLVTSSIFLPSLCAHITPVSRSRLLKSYLTAACIWAVARGQPLLDIKGFFEEMKQPATKVPSVPENPKTETTAIGDIWDKLLEEARVHHDEHLTKTIRSLSAWASAFGSRKARVPLGSASKALAKDFVEGEGLGKGLSINTNAANQSAKVQKRGRKEGEIVVEEADLSPRTWREWKNGHLSMSPVRDSSVDSAGKNGMGHRRTMSEDADLSPRAWREAVNHGYHPEAEGARSDDENKSDEFGVDVGPRETREFQRNEEDCMPPTELPGSEYLDGGLFLRVGVLTLQKMGWDIEKGKIESQNKKEEEMEMGDEEFWDFEGFFEKNYPAPKPKC